MQEHSTESMASYEVKLQEPVLVQPLSATTEASHAYFLTYMDQALAGVVVETVLVFDAQDALTRRHNGDPAKLLKEALRKVLVHFYPLAGRLRLSPDDGRLFIECNGRGVSFVEADVDIEISELGDFSQPDHASTLGRLVFPLPDTDDRPLLAAQVTRFKCGGFVIGFAFQHCVFDGVAAVEFVNSWAETARGVPLSTPPVLDRTFLSSSSPLQIKYPHTEYLEIEELSATQNNDVSDISSGIMTRSFCFTAASIEMVRKKALEDGVLSKCTTFEAMCGLIWRARTRALWSKQPEQKVKLLTVVDARKSGALPKGYVGNGLVFTCALTSAGELEEKPLSHAVKLVQHAVARVTGEYMSSQMAYMERHKLGFPPLAATLGITAWSKLPFYSQLDFGWGTPIHVGPISSVLEEAAIFLAYGLGINVVLALPPNAMHTFEELLHPFLNPIFLSPSRL